MSQLWKSELRLRLERTRCSAQVLAPWSRRVLAQTQVWGPPPASIGTALESLRGQYKDELPRQARLIVPDELAYLALRPPRGSWALAMQDAREHFARTIGRRDLHVQVVPMPGAQHWLAAAIDPADLGPWQRLLAQAQIAVVHVHLGLVDDLRAIAPQIGDNALLALLRDEGVTMLRVSHGAPVELAWERCDADSLRCIEQRLLAFQNLAEHRVPERMAILCRDEAQRSLWRAVARGHQWALLLRDAAPLLPKLREAA